MAGVIDRLVYLVGYETDQASLDYAKRGLNSLVSVATKLTAVLSAVSGAAFATASSAADAGDSIAKTARAFGATVEGYQELVFAAGQSGMSAEKFTMAWQRSIRRVAEAAQGTGEAQNAIKTLGLNAQELASMSPEDQLSAISDALSNIDDENERLRLSFKFFDSEGAKGMSNLLSGGAEEIRKLREEARATGLLLTKEDTKAAEDFTDQLGRLSLYITGIRNRIGLQLMPVFSDLIDRFLEFWKINGAIIIQNISGFLASVVVLASELADGFILVARAVNEAAEALGGWDNVARVAMSAGLAVGITKVIKLLPKLTRAFILMNAQLIKRVWWYALLAGATLSIDDIWSWVEGEDSFIGRLMGPFDEFKKSFQAFTDEVSKWIDGIVDKVSRVVDKIEGFFSLTSPELATTPQTAQEALIAPNYMQNRPNLTAPSNNLDKSSSTVTNNQNVEINVQGNDPEANAISIKRELERNYTDDIFVEGP